MVEICPVCGLPKPLCICGSINKEGYTVEIFSEKRKYNKTMTIIRGLELEKSEMKKLASELKSKCSSGGTIKNGEIEVQGEHTQKIADILKSKGYNVVVV